MAEATTPRSICTMSPRREVVGGARIVRSVSALSRLLEG